MRRLNKLSIRSEKIMSNDELVSLRGGYGGDPYGGPGTECPDGKAEYYCACFGSVGAWYGCYATSIDASDSIRDWCLSEMGSCTKQ